MSRAEKFIQDCTRNCSQLHYNSACTLRHCITPDQAKEAVEIAREEMTEKAYAAFCKVCKLNCNHRECYYLNNFKQAMEDE